ncbi:MAG: hypothetical protein DMG57_04025 [Acidobacteria bacterium]|nr:MAG: hypothetical protein DMG57_04025 [Acidobacteriota bacterium]
MPRFERPRTGNSARRCNAEGDGRRRRAADGRTPLHFAVQSAHVDMIFFLTQHGADLSAGRKALTRRHRFPRPVDTSRNGASFVDECVRSDFQHRLSPQKLRRGKPVVGCGRSHRLFNPAPPEACWTPASSAYLLAIAAPCLI